MSERRRLEGSLWSGMNLLAWCRLLLRNRCAVTPRRIPTVLSITALALLNTILGWVQNLQYGRRVRRVDVPDDPIFIIGHWRSGTTMLHELMALDEQNRCPTTYESLAPNGFLVSEAFVRRWLRSMFPRKRPFDNMRVGLDRPQEDEIALCNLGLPSPFLTVAFPNRPPQDPKYVDLDELSPRELRRWKATLRRFYQSILFKRGGRLVSKSPQNTFRVKILVDMFPRAKFVHIVRNPYSVFPSTVHFWTTMYNMYGLQQPDFRSLDKDVYETLTAMYRKLQATQPLVNDKRFIELKYEQLVNDPVETMKTLYEQLELNNFQAVRPAFEQYAARSQKYKTNQYELTEEAREEISRNWQTFFERYGYSRGS